MNPQPASILFTCAMPEEHPGCELPPHCRLVVTGIGKVLSVTGVALALRDFRADLIVSLGFCGGLNGTPQGALVMPDEVLQWDLHLNGLDIPLGQGYGPHCPVTLPKLDLESVPHPVRGRLISGDRFVDAGVELAHGAVAVDMETAALAVFARQAGIPFYCIREVSDIADGPQGLTHTQFMDYIREKGPGYRAAVLELAGRVLT